MKPLFIKQECLKCHAKQNYEIGDVRGGIAVSIPIKTIIEQAKHKKTRNILTFSLIWLIGFIGLTIAYKKLSNSLRKKEQADKKIKEQNISLYLKIEFSDKESTIFIGKTNLKKILEPILDNAIKFTNDGFIEFGYSLVQTRLNLVSEPSTLSQQYIEIYVKDTGIGIKKENQKSIFNRFEQEEKELSKKTYGLGLGLSIAKENAELLGGKITVKSEKGKGTTFFVSLPYKPVL